MATKRRSTGPSEAARLLGKDRKQLQRWRKVPGAPFDSDGLVDVEELRAWAQATGRLDRPANRPPEFERMAAELVSVPVQEVQATQPASPQAPPTKPAGPASLEELSNEDREALEALFGADPEKLLVLAGQGVLTPELLKKAAAIGRTRRELAEAQKKELENKARAGELVEVEEMKRFWVGQIHLVKSRFMSVPGKLAPRLAGKGYDEVYQAIEEELHSILQGFAVEVPT